MKKVLLFFVACFVNIALFGQNNACAGTTPLCMSIGTTLNYANTSNGVSAQTGPAYGCLGSEPNPNWFYITTSGSGTMTYQINQGTTLGANDIDVDFVCWGPYNAANFPNACSNLTGGCGGASTTPNPYCTGGIVDCSYSTSAIEMLTINSTGPGNYYIILITNYANVPGYISLTQTSGPNVSCCIPAAITAARKDICLGDTTTLNASTGNSGMLYTWVAGTDTISSDTIPFISVSPTVTTTYTLSKTPTTSTCSASWDTLTISVHQPGFLMCSVYNGTICAGSQTATLTASGSMNYTWTPSISLDNSNTATVVASPTATTVYTVTGNCPNSSVTTTVTVNPAPSFSLHASSLTAICTGTIDTLSAIGGAYSYTWTPATTLNTDTGSIVIASPSVTTVYSVIASDGSACTTNKQISITVNSGLAPTSSSNPSHQITGCQASGSSILHIDQAGSPNEFTWYQNGNYYAATTGDLLISYATTGTTIYSVTDSSSCGVSPPLTFTVIVVPSPTSTISITSQQTLCNVCNGAATILSSGGTSPYHYSWINGDTTQSVTDLCAGNSNCTVSDQNGCSSITNFTISNASVLPVINFSVVQDTIPHYWDLYPSVSGGTAPYSYFWDWGDGTNDTVLYASHTYSVPANYAICFYVTDANGCTQQYCQNDSLYRTTSSTYAYINVINTTTGIASISKSNYSVSVYPNPANGSFTIEANSTSKHNIQLFDVSGRMVLSNIIEGKTTIDASNLSEGIYNLSIISNEGVINKKLVIVR